MNFENNTLWGKETNHEEKPIKEIEAKTGPYKVTI